MAPYLPAWSLPLCLSGPLPACPPALLLGSGLAKGGGVRAGQFPARKPLPLEARAGSSPICLSLQLCRPVGWAQGDTGTAAAPTRQLFTPLK